MDQRAVRLVKEHYNRHANTETTKKEALQRRRRGPALPLKQFHNLIKNKLIRRFCYGVDKLLDFCCGRGGDIRKWELAKVKYCKGIDLSPEEIEEAKRRFSDSKSDTENSALTADFESSDVLGRDIYEDDSAPYDAVTCFFALHYFMVTEAAIENLLFNVSKNLKKGGYFIGTCPDGKRVIEALLDGKHEGRLETKMLKIVRKWKGRPECFGSAFTCEITDTVTEGDEDNHGSYEYLVFTTPLKHIGAKFGLKLITDYEDQDLEPLFDQKDKSSGFKHFFPRFQKSDPSLETASSLNMAFVFQKVVEIDDDEEEANKFTLSDLENFATTLPPAAPEEIQKSASVPKRKQPSEFHQPDSKKTRE